MDWSIQDVARLAGTTSRTLRHYAATGILEPTRIGSNGYRYYDERALATLQRILMLRELGLGIAAIAEVLEGQRDNVEALRGHLHWLQQEKQRLERQISSVENTIKKMKKGEKLMAEEMFNGFDHTQYKGEVEQRWGADSYADSDAWWRSMDATAKAQWWDGQQQLSSDWIAAAASGVAPDGEAGQALAKRHADWLVSIPGTPRGENGAPAKAYFGWMADTYVTDDRFAINYGGTDGAAFVRDAMHAYAAKYL